MPVEGIDCAFSYPSAAAVLAAGLHFVIGYVSQDAGKNITAEQCANYRNGGVDVGIVWETVPDRALAGAVAGIADGRAARRQAGALGFPAVKTIYCAVDFDATATQIAGPVAAYLKAFRAAAGQSGVYGGHRVVAYVLDHEIMSYAWQTYAWSGGVWDNRAQLRQYSNGHTIGGCDVDYDQAVISDWGQWKAQVAVPTEPTPTKPVSISKPSPDIWDYQMVDVHGTAHAVVVKTYLNTVALEKSVATLTAAVADLQAAMKVLQAAIDSPVPKTGT